ncbi:hypothetical protein HJFPF1_05189 [Paramyrothecium foliicola]|nr:hypothetical protein HJFPF1_05189 [Paramyrothecium foliicola]
MEPSTGCHRGPTNTTTNASMSDGPTPPTPGAVEKLMVELWVLLGVVTVITVLRTVWRIRSNSVKQLQLDDYLVWLALIGFAAEGALAYTLGSVAHGLANNSMSDAARAALQESSAEYQQRIKGSRIHLAGWSIYSVSLWALKASWLVFYLRLTQSLGRSYRVRIKAGFVLVAVTWLAGITTLLLSCRPFKKYWQISPDPGIWVWYTFNVVTDLYLLSIPLPMLWGARLGKWRKFSLIFLFSGGVFVVVCATLRATLIVTNPTDGTLIAGAWGVRETFVAITTTNLPHVFALFKAWLGPWFGIQFSTARSSRKQTEGTVTAVNPIPAGGSSRKSWRERGHATGGLVQSIPLSESEEGFNYFRLQDVDQSTIVSKPLPSKQSWV